MRIKICYATAIVLALTSCSHKTVETKPEAPQPPIVVQPIPTQASIANILLAAETSGLSKYKWKDRGVAPKGYPKGMALTYARAYCDSAKIGAAMVYGSSDTDALKYYDISPSLRNEWAFMIGLGMRESSGKYCEGRDISASNTSADTAEAGMFQTSYNAVTSHPSLKAMMKEYHKQCYLEVFKEGVPGCRESSIYGSGLGADFQQMSKNCPTFAAEFASQVVRNRRKHYGPINRKEVEFRPEAVTLLIEVERIVDSNPSVCKDL